MIPLRPGFLRSMVGMVVCGFAFAFVYRAFAEGGAYTYAAALLILQGFLFAGMQGALLGAAFNIPVYALMHFPVAQQTDPFGDILVTLIVYLALVPGLYIVHAVWLKRIGGAILSALLIVPGYVTALVVPTMLVAVGTLLPRPLGEYLYQVGPGVNAGASLMFGGAGMAFGFLWGIGAMSLGSTAHEGPTYYASAQAAEQPVRRPVREIREQVTKILPELRAHVQPMIRPFLIAVGVVALLTGAMFFVATNPIVQVSRPQTFDAVADAATVTGDKFIVFVVIAVVILGGIVSIAAGLAFGIAYLNRAVNMAKKEKAAPVEIKRAKASRLTDFFVQWVRDILAGVGKVFAR